MDRAVMMTKNTVKTAQLHPVAEMKRRVSIAETQVEGEGKPDDV